MARAPLNTIRTVAELRRQIDFWRGAGQRIGLVPTMGALHEGHLSLVRAMGDVADKTVVSIFVNPAQFAPHEDFDEYPRNESDDAEKLRETAGDLIYAPLQTEMYPGGFATGVSVGAVADGLESDTRPHFFGGVATVVSKLLIQCWPDLAIFGEKDYQQLQVIRRMTRDLNLPVEILGGAIVREADGLAMSSRNAYLSPEERVVAGQLNKIMWSVASRARASGDLEGSTAQGCADLKAAGFDAVDYLEIRDADSLATLQRLSREARLLAAVKIGKTRLIDNMPV
jgi:pantoate--beta-alanine ligase